MRLSKVYSSTFFFSYSSFFFILTLGKNSWPFPPGAYVLHLLSFFPFLVNRNDVEAVAIIVNHRINPEEEEKNGTFCGQRSGVYADEICTDYFWLVFVGIAKTTTDPPAWLASLRHLALGSTPLSLGGESTEK